MEIVSPSAFAGLSAIGPLMPIPAELMRSPTLGSSALSLSSTVLMPESVERSATTGTILTPFMEDASSLSASSRLAIAHISSKGVLKYSPLSPARSPIKAFPMPDEAPVIIAILLYIKASPVKKLRTLNNTLYIKILKENALKADPLLAVIVVETVP